MKKIWLILIAVICLFFYFWGQPRKREFGKETDPHQYSKILAGEQLASLEDKEKAKGITEVVFLSIDLLEMNRSLQVNDLKKKNKRRGIGLIVVCVVSVIYLCVTILKDGIEPADSGNG